MDPILNELVERLRENLGASAVIMDTEHQYTAEMEGFLLMVHHLEDSGQVLLGTCVAPLPREGRERVLLALLQGQYFFSAPRARRLPWTTRHPLSCCRRHTPCAC